MPCYVDPLRQYGGSREFRWQHSCHLFADTDEELHAFAGRIGLQRRWAQLHRPEFHHYDLTAKRRARAVAAGAVEVSTRTLVLLVRSRRQAAAVPVAAAASQLSQPTAPACAAAAHI